jgi:4-hydroxy-2-oxoheptanedioate aldolase
MADESVSVRSKVNRLRAIWSRSGITLGAIVTSPSIPIVQVMARSGLDWIIIDLEHGAIDLKDAHAMIAATGGTPLVPLVRVPERDAWHAKAPLDLGALGICFPMTTSGADAQAAARAVRYPPQGERFWGPFYAPLRWNMTMREYLNVADDEVLSIGTIEHIAVLRTIRDVVNTPGLDVAFIGPGDLATSMGLKGDRDHPSVREAISQLEEEILRSPVVLGGVAPTVDQANAMIKRGYRALVVGFDWSLLQRGISAAIDGIER